MKDKSAAGLFFVKGKGEFTMKVAIIMGSNSDWPILEPAEKTLKEFGVEVEVVVASAHRTPDQVHEFAAGARDRGVEAIIAAAGLAAHLGGVIAAYTTLPVIGLSTGRRTRPSLPWKSWPWPIRSWWKNWRPTG